MIASRLHRRPPKGNAVNRRLAIAAVISCALRPAIAAQTALTVYSSASPGTLSVESFRTPETAIPGYAVVREERTFELASGRNAVRVTDVPALIDPTTVSFTSLEGSGAARVLEQSFEFDLATANTLLARYVDQEVVVEQASGNGIEAIRGTLLNAQGPLIVRQADGSVRIVTTYAGVRLSGLPGGLITRPTLVWSLESPKAGRQRAQLAYQTRGMTWWTDYNFTYAERAGACRVDVGAWVTLVNRSGASYSDAKLKLIAGDVQRAQPRPQPFAAAAPRMTLADKAPGFEEKAFFEYHLYTLGRPVSLPENSIRQVELFPMAPNVACEKTLVYDGAAVRTVYATPLTDRNFGVQSNRKVDVYLRLRNAAASGLGVPLPAGRVRVSKRDEADDALEFVGEDLIDHTARDEPVQLRLGSAFDVVGERRQLDFRLDTSAKTMEEDIEVRVRNQKPDAAVDVVVKESLYRWSTWSVVRKTHDFSKEDARTIHFPLHIAPKGEAVVRYTVRYTW
jgi:hypothetical protein